MKHYRFTKAIQVSDALRKDLVDGAGKPIFGSRKFAAGQVMAEDEVSGGSLETLKRTGRVVELSPEEFAKHEAELAAATANPAKPPEQAPAPPATPDGKAKKK